MLHSKNLSSERLRFRLPSIFSETKKTVLFTYGEVEAALAKIHHVHSTALGTFRARIKHFQRIGLVPAAPGKGQKIAYKAEDAVIWGLAFELTELGLSPDIIAKIIKEHRVRLLLPFCNDGSFPSDGVSTIEDQFFCLSGSFLSGVMSKATNWVVTIPAQVTSKPDLIEEFFNHDHSDRSLVLNLSALKRKLGSALNIDWSSAINAKDIVE